MHPGVGPLVEAEQLYVRQSRLRERLLAAEGGEVGRLVLFDVGLGAGSNALAARSASERAAGERGAPRAGQLRARPRRARAGAGGTAPPSAGAASRPTPRARCWPTARTRPRARTGGCVHGDLLETLAQQTLRADIVFWDPFSPRANPALWTVAAFAARGGSPVPRCTLFTYSASTATRVALLLAGWAVGVGDAIGDKAQTTAAAVAASDLARPLDRGWLARLSRPDAPLPSDAPADAIARAQLAPQFR